MCGIIGFNFRDEELAAKMNDSIAHRGPDDSGIFSDGVVTIGNRRLAIIDLSVAGHQPMFNESKKVSLVYNGEIYNTGDLKQELTTLGCSFFSHTDTEVILRGYEKWGTKIFSKLRGMWAVAIYDLEKGKLILSRDFFGIKPLYYTWDGERLVFASEMRALKIYFEKNNKKLSFSQLGVQSYFVLGYTPHPLTVFEEIKKIKPGEILTVNLSDQSLSSDSIDWRAEAEDQIESNPADFEAVMLESVEKHLLADVPVGIFLSGGADSTLIALMLKKLGQKLNAFTVKIQGRGDADYATKIAAFTGLRPTIINLDGGAFAEMYQKNWDTLDEPVADNSLIPSLLVAREAANQVKVVMTGEGGDELFWGYQRHQELVKFSALASRRRISALDYHRPENSFFLKYLRPVLRRLRLLDAESQSDFVSAYLELAVASAGLTDSRATADFLAQNLPIPKRLEPNILDQQFYLPDDLLFKTDFATMNYSIEGRTPILDRKVYQFASKLPPTAKLSGSVGKRLVKDYLAKNLPPELIFRKKEGFSFPLQTYLFKRHSGEIKEAVAALLDWQITALPQAMLTRILKDEAYLDLLKSKFPAIIFSILTFYKVVKKYDVRK